jgi:hypothetical protein
LHKLNEERIAKLLPTLAEPLLRAMQNYEQIYGNRVSVLRAIDKLTEPQPVM